MTKDRSGILWDISGAFGDIGVLFPLAAALVLRNGFHAAPLFITAGIFYLGAALYFRVTMPVQPLKAMSAIALATGLGASVMSAAGITMGIVLLVMALTGFSDKVGRLFPPAVVRGIQLGLGLLLLKTAFPLLGADFTITAMALLCIILTACVLKGMPPFLPLLAFSMVYASFSGNGILPLTTATIPELPAPDTFVEAFSLLVLPQIGLTLGNAIVATEATARQLYGTQANRVTLKSLAVSMGIANIAAGLLGGVPMCHGSGGITAHRVFGASSVRSGCIIGGVLLLLGIFSCSGIPPVVTLFPVGVLGVMLCFVAIQHGILGVTAMTDAKTLSITLSTALAGYFDNNLTTGLIAGLAVHALWAAAAQWASRPMRDAVSAPLK